MNRNTNKPNWTNVTTLRAGQESEEERDYCPVCRVVYSNSEACDCDQPSISGQRRLRPAA